MSTILFGFALLIIGGTMIVGGAQTTSDRGFIIMGFGLFVEIGGLAAFLTGLKSYFVNDIFDELKKIAQQTKKEDV